MSSAPNPASVKVTLELSGSSPVLKKLTCDFPPNMIGMVADRLDDPKLAKLPQAIAVILVRFKMSQAKARFTIKAKKQARMPMVKVIKTAKDSGHEQMGPLRRLANGELLKLFKNPRGKDAARTIELEASKLQPAAVTIKLDGNPVETNEALKQLADAIAATWSWELADYDFEAEAENEPAPASTSPSVSSEQPQKSSVQPKLTDDQRQAIERRWQYIQNHPIVRVEVLLLLKANVGYDWLRDLLDDCRLNFGKDEHTFGLKQALERASQPNTEELPRNLKTPICSFWEIYPDEAEYWFKEIAPASRQFRLVAGFDTALPWAEFGIASVTKLQDLTMFTDIGLSLPPRAFRVGVEEFEMRFVGETFSFSFRLSEHNLDFLQEFARQVKNDDLMNFGGHVDGVQLLESFHRQMFPEDIPATARKRGIFGGMSGPGGIAISFYPSMPKGFNSTAESKKYSFTISVPKEIDSAAVIRDLEAKIRKNPKSPMLYGRLAAHYSQVGRMSDAMECLDTAFKKAPPMAELHGLMAQLLMEVGRLAEALTQLQAAEKLAPKNALVQTKLGVCLDEMGCKAEALAHFRSAARSEPENAEYQFNLSMALARAEQYPEALTAANRAVELAPDSPRSVRHLALVLAAVGKHSQAIPHFEKATHLEPENAKAHDLCAEYLASQKQHEKALLYLRRAIELEETALLNTRLAASLAALERWNEAEIACRRAVELEPKNPEMLGSLASVVAKLGNLSEGLQLCRRAIGVGETARTFSVMSQILAELGSMEEAEDVLRKGLSLDPHDLVMQTNLGVMLANRGELGDAIKLFEQLVRAHPDAAVAKQYLDRLQKLT